MSIFDGHNELRRMTYLKGTPGVHLVGARYKENVTQAELSKLTGISIKNISAMENSKKPIDVATAFVLAETLNTDYRVFLWEMS